MAQTFLSFFNAFKMNKEIQALLNEAALDAVELHMEERRMLLRVCPKKILHKYEIDRIVEHLCDVFSVQSIDFQVKYLPSFFDESYLEDIKHQIKKDIAICNGFLEGSTCQLKNEELIIYLQNGGAKLMEEHHALQYIQKMLYNEFVLKLSVSFAGVTELQNCVSNEREVLKAAVEAAKTAAVAMPSNSSAPVMTPARQEYRSRGPSVKVCDKTNVPIDFTGKSLYGRQVRGAMTRLCDITQEAGRVTVWGDVFNVNIKDTRDGRRTICVISITDYTSSVYVKLFDDKDKLAPVINAVAKKGATLMVSGTISYDKYEHDIVLSAENITLTTKQERLDTSDVKRVELHLHTNMSQMDGITEIGKYIERAAKWGHKAIAITDHGVLQAFPDAAKAAKKYPDLKVIYGVEAYYVDDTVPAIYGVSDTSLDGTYTVFDVETTGLNSGSDRMTEIGAVRVVNGEVVDSFNTFVNPGIPIPEKITKLTGIDDNTVVGAPKPGEALRAFMNFAGDSVLVAHNAPFDIGFMKAAANREKIPFENGYVDTVPCARFLYPELKNHKLNTVAHHIGAGNFKHHRACDDAAVLAKIFIVMIRDFRLRHQSEKIGDINTAISTNVDPKKLTSYHQIIIAKNYIGLKNLYKLVSAAHLHYFNKRPRIPKSLLMQHREGLILGSACEAGELYTAVLNRRPWNDLKHIAEFYDYLEIQPICNNQFLVDNGTLPDENAIRELNRTIVRLGEELQKPVVATCDAHFMDEYEETFRRIILAGNGFADADRSLPLYFRSTTEMLEEFSYLGEDKAYEIVVKNTNLVADWCETIKPVPDGNFPPAMENAEEDLKRLSIEKAKQIYGEKLPEIVEKRMEKELNSIITHGFAVMYMIAQRLVQKSLNDGYLVGSRGSVGSSFVAFLSGITEVNSLCPHYICENCHNVEWLEDGEYEAGCDMPEKNCPVCNTKFKKDGFDIPFETFLGFDGDKEPDIDLNFSGEYQANAHKYTEILFGEGYVFRAGTIGALAEKTAFGYVKKYLDEHEKVLHRAEEDRLVLGCTGIKRTTGQHPGGIVIVPKTNEVYDFCPVQHPADDPNSSIITTHFDYNCLHDTLLKLDILGHDDPTMIRMLEDLTGLDARTIPLDDPQTMSIFTTNESLNIKPDDIITEVGSIAIPEFGTSFVRQMLIDTAPTSFAELVRISGLSHGTDVWLNNAQDLVRSGTATLKQAICTRDDIMLYLIHKGVVPKHAFKIMESVRKGKGLNDEWIAEMKENNVPAWYIQSCQKIKYMFPKAHAVAYVTMAFRIAYYKVHYPLQFYAAYFTVRADDFDAEHMIYGIDKVRSKLKELNASQDSTTKDKNLVTILEVCYEMYQRGFSFLPIDIYQSDAKKFIVTENALLPPFNSLQGVGDNAAVAICEARREGKFISVDELASRSKVSKTVIETLQRNHALQSMPKDSQMSMF